MPQPVVLKFGGTSMDDEHTWRQVMDIIKRYEQPVVVVSATARTTRQLVKTAELAQSNLDEALKIAQQINERHQKLIQNFLDHFPEKETASVSQKSTSWIDGRIEDLEHHLHQIAEEGALSMRCKDSISSIGEQLSSYLFAICGTLYGLNSQWVDARTVIKTDSEFGSANPFEKEIQKASGQLTSSIENNIIPIIGGYYGEDPDKNITTLGFEGSDYTASLLGAALGAGSIEIWTDVSGIYTCDPRVVEQAQPIEELSFREATELAYFGAKVLHPSTMKPASGKKIPILVKNIFDPDQPGTKIHSESKSDGLVKAITFLDKITILTITSTNATAGYHFLEEVFSRLSTFHLPVDVVTTTEAAVSVALKDELITESVLSSLGEIGEVEEDKNRGIISLIGCNLPQSNDIAQRILEVIPNPELSMLSFSHPKKNLNIVLPEKDLISAVKTIHNNLFAEKD